MRSFFLALTLTGLAASTAVAQIGNPAGVAPDTRQAAPGKPAPHQANQQDQLFAQQAAIGGMAEVALGKLAGQRAQSSAVKDFARLMIEDHGKANDKLATLAKAAGIPLPREPDSEHKAVQDHLESLRGAEFDAAYIAAQVQDHQKTAQLLQWEIGSGQDAELQRFAAENLPVVLHHLQTVQGLAAQLNGQTPRELSVPEPKPAPSNPAERPKR